MKKLMIVITLTGMLVLGFVLNTKQQVNAAYSGHIYTIPKKMRGQWHFAYHKNVNIAEIPQRYKHIYKKIILTKHGITFIRRGRTGLHGHYILMKVPTRCWTNKQITKAEKYARHHHWLGVSFNSKNSFSFSKAWLHNYESSSTGSLTLRSQHLRFANPYTKDFYKK